nr:EAL domain-containing protein [Pseudomonadota bacterium]
DFGYPAGDALLCTIVERLSTLPALAVARLGADAFAAAFMLSGVAQVEEILGDLAATLADRFTLSGTDNTVRFAMGYATGGQDSDAHGLMHRATTALRRSAASPVPCLRAFDASAEQAARHRVRSIADLQGALSAEEFVFHYQPQIDLASGALVGAEALLRWDHGRHGILTPEHFMGLAEEAGLMLAIGAWGLRAVASFAASVNRQRSLPIRFSFNVSILELMQRDMAALVREVLADTGCHAEWLTLELTENVMADHEAGIVRMFKALRDLGIGLSIDDFGKGYANFGYLEAFSVSEIKIDRSFVGDVARSTTKGLIIESVVRLGKALGIPVVAEGIEREADLAVVRGIGCSIGQGYLFSRPLDGDAFMRLIGGATGGAAAGAPLFQVWPE